MPQHFHCAVKLMTPCPKAFEFCLQKGIVNLEDKEGKPSKLSMSFLSVMPNRTAYKKREETARPLPLCVSYVAGEIMTLLPVSRTPNCIKTVFRYLFLFFQFNKQAVNINDHWSDSEIMPLGIWKK